MRETQAVNLYYAVAPTRVTWDIAVLPANEHGSGVPREHKLAELPPGAEVFTDTWERT